MSVPHLGMILLVALGYLIEALGLGDVILGKDLICMVVLMHMFR
jgi:hypothetical protein